MDIVKDIFVFLIGLCWGSFLNVCIYRLPKGISIICPASSCPNCGAKISLFDNIPLLSYILLKGRCRSCGMRISLVYPTVETLTGLIFFLIWRKFGLSIDAFLYALFCSLLIVISFIDIQYKIIPDLLSLGGAGGGLLASLGLSGITFWDSLLGLFLGGGILFIVAYGYYKLRKIEGMGGGDIKLLGMIGSWLGYKSIVQVLLIGSVAGILVGLPMILIKKDRYFQIPFGPFLSGAAIFVLFLDLVHLKISLF